MSYGSIVFSTLGIATAVLGAAPPPAREVPAGSLPARVAPGGVSILPSGRFVTPVGKRLYTGENLWNAILSPSGDLAVGFCSGGLMVHPLNGVGTPRFLPLKKSGLVGVFTRDGARLLVSGGDDGGVLVLDASGWAAPVALDSGKPFVTEEPKILQRISAGEDGYINDLVLSPDEKWAYGVDITRQKLAVFDLTAGKLASEAPAGREPYALAISEDGKKLFVANIGLFDYSTTKISRPAFGFPSKDAESGIDFEGKFVPGLGAPTVPDAQSIWSYALADPASPIVAKKAKTGMLIHAPADGSTGKAVGGSAPNALLLRGNSLWVSNANSDTVQRFDSETLALKQTVKLAPDPALARLRGAIPAGMALSRDGSRLYVCAAGLNAVAAIDPAAGKVVGWIPTGWFPVQCRLGPDGKTLCIATQKGLGRGPRGPKSPRLPGDERYGFSDMPGMIQVAPLPADLKAGSAATLLNNGLTPAKSAPLGLPKQIEYVVFITKENHTFDGIFGGLKNANGEPDYAEFGREGWLKEKGRAERVPIMPNHLALAERWAISDNFYMEPQASGDGHRWLVGVYPSIWTTRLFYAGWKFKATDAAKGRLVSFGSNGSQIPEDYLENGSLWEHLNSGGVTFRNYGEGFEFPGVDEDSVNSRSGAGEVANFPMPKVLFDNTCFEFPIFNTNIPDIARVDWFLEDLAKQRAKNGGKIPKFLNIRALQRPRHRRAAREGVPICRELHGRQRSRAGPHDRGALEDARVEEDGRLRDSGRFRRRQRSRRSAPQLRAGARSVGEKGLRQPPPHEHSVDPQDRLPNVRAGAEQPLRRHGDRPRGHVHDRARLRAVQAYSVRSESVQAGRHVRSDRSEIYPSAQGEAACRHGRSKLRRVAADARRAPIGFRRPDRMGR